MKQVYSSALKRYNEQISHFGSQLKTSLDQYEIYYYRSKLIRAIFRQRWVVKRLKKRQLSVK